MASKGRRSGADDASFQVERALVGGVLASRVALDAVSLTLSAEDFSDDALRSIYEAALLVAERRPGSEADFVLIQEEMGQRGTLASSGGATAIVDLAGYPSELSSIVEYAGVIRQSAAERKLAKAAREIPGILSEVGLSFADKASRVLAMVDAASKGRLGDDGVKTLASVAKEYLDEIEGVVSTGRIAPSSGTGFVDLDGFLGGGFGNTDLIVVGARPAMGKTAFVTNIAMNVARRERKPPFFVSLEMSANQLVSRTVASITGLPSDIVKRRVPYGGELEQLRQTIDSLLGVEMFIEDSGAMDIRRLSELARRRHRECGGLSMVAVDYIQLMSGLRTDNRVQEISEISRGLKMLAKELQVPVFGLSQLSRAVESRENKRPLMSDLRESGAIEADADVVIMLYRDAYYAQKEAGFRQDPNEVEEVEVIVAKNRHGAVGTVALGFQPSYTRFREIEARRTSNYSVPMPKPDPEQAKMDSIFGGSFTSNPENDTPFAIRGVRVPGGKTKPALPE